MFISGINLQGGNYYGAISSTPAVVTDPYFNYVSLLLPGNGSNGAQNNTFIDSSTNNYTVTRFGNATQGTFTPFSQPAGNWSNFFDGTGDYLTTAASSAFDFGTGDWTVECYFYIAGNSSTDNDGERTAGLFALNSGGTSSGFTVALLGSASTTGTGLQIYKNTNTTVDLNKTVTIDQNTWHHLAITKASNTIRFFLNGTQQGTSDSDSTSWGSSTLIPTIGRHGFTGYIQAFNGYISNIRVLKGTALYTANFTVPTTPLTAITNTSLLTCQDNRFLDNSSNAFAITRNGDVRVTTFSPFAPTAAYSTSTNGGSLYSKAPATDNIEVSGTNLALGNSDFTVELWFYADTLDANYKALYSGRIPDVSGQGFDILVWNPDGGQYVQVTTANVFIFRGVGSIIITGQWYHVAITRVGTTWRYFLNGVLQGSTTRSYNLINSTNRIGYGNTGATGFYVSSLRIVKGTAVYTGNFTPPTAPVTAIANTSLLLNSTNAGITDAATRNVLETVGNAKISTAQSKWGGGSMSFDGTGDWLTAPNNINLQLGTGNFTIEFWVYLGATGAARGFVGKGGASTGWLVSATSSNTVQFTYGSSTITSTGALAGSTWYHIAVVREGTGSNQTKIYINGTNDGTGTVSTDFNQTEVMYVGANRTGGDALNGYINDLRITKDVARYTTNFTPPVAAFPVQ